jgi:hypothetical protein
MGGQAGGVKASALLRPPDLPRGTIGCELFNLSFAQLLSLCGSTSLRLLDIIRAPRDNAAKIDFLRKFEASAADMPNPCSA